MTERDTPGTLKDNEPHPAGVNAFAWIKSLPVEDLLRWQEAFACTAISGNRLAEVCSETLRRILSGGTVSDRYALGLAWTMKYGDGNE